MAKNYWSEKKLFFVFKEMKTTDNGLKETITKFQEQQMKYWLENYDPYEVLHILCDRDKDATILANWNKYLPIWMKYVNEFEKRNGGHETEAIDGLCAYFDKKRHIVFEIVQSM